MKKAAGLAAVFEAFGVRGQPVTVLVANGKIVQTWRGASEFQALRDALDNLALFNA